jgi:uncharacterized C2H2 Zn-finger protein
MKKPLLLILAAGLMLSGASQIKAMDFTIDEALELPPLFPEIEELFRLPQDPPSNKKRTIDRVDDDNDDDSDDNLLVNTNFLHNTPALPTNNNNNNAAQTNIKKSAFIKKIQVQENDKTVSKWQCIYPTTNGVCGKNFNCSSIYGHIDQHTQAAARTCHFCTAFPEIVIKRQRSNAASKCYSLQTNFLHHLKAHTKPFECNQCDERFSREKTLVDHLEKIHGTINNAPPSDESLKASPCLMCGLQNITDLPNHKPRCRALLQYALGEMKVAQTDENMRKIGFSEDKYELTNEFKCPHCQLILINKIGLSNHISKIHNNNQNNETVEQKNTSVSPNFKIVEVQQEDKKVLTYKCLHTLASGMTCDVLLVGGFPAWRQHYLRIHSDAKPFPCDKCDSKFKTKRQLTVHSSQKHALNSTSANDQQNQ